MEKWLLAAEADKIQDFIFRSSHLREVVGGSELLTRFCTEATPYLLARQRYASVDEATLAEVAEKVIVADGGSFSLLFDDETEAIAFGDQLARLYRKMTGSSLTVAPPEPWDGETATFPAANEGARGELARAKRERQVAIADPHGPPVAFCSSCGVALAADHERLHAGMEDERPNYLCPVCRRKAREVDAQAAASGKRATGGFLERFRVALGERARGKAWSRQPEDAAGGWDPRNYVAYLVADGNGMGQVFNQCQDPEQLRELSKSLTRVLIQSLAEPTKLLLETEAGIQSRFLPVLPLILGGDDVFLLMPAPYALDFARTFCLEYERQMKEVVERWLPDVQPTMSAAVVICKASYPYTLAHRHGEELLAAAKGLSKTVAQEQGTTHSVVDFDVILGSRLAIDEESKGPCRASLRPYWAVAFEQEDVLFAPNPLPKGVGLPVDYLLAWRRELGGVAARRMAQLRALFDTLPKDKQEIPDWQARMEKWRARVVDRAALRINEVDRLLGDLGGTASGWWYRVFRPGGATFLGHGLPDLLRAWDFSKKLTVAESEYIVKEG